MNEIHPKIIDALIEEISSYYEYSINENIVVKIEKLLDIVNNQFDEDYDFIVTKDYQYWGITDDQDLYLNVAVYYILSAKKEFQRKNLHKALFFLHLAEFYILKETDCDERYQSKLMIIRCNKCFVLLFLNETEKALTGFQQLAVSASYFNLNYEKTNESEACKTSIQLGEASCLIELGKLSEAERSINNIAIRLAKQPYTSCYDKYFVLQSLIAKIRLKQKDKNAAFNIITDAITEGFYYETNYAGNMQRQIELCLRDTTVEDIDFEDIIDMMLELHIRRNIGEPTHCKDVIFI